MKRCFLQALLVMCGFGLLPGCSDSDNEINLTDAVVAAGTDPGEVVFRPGVAELTVDFSVAVSGKAPEALNFDVKMSADSEVAAGDVSFSASQVTIKEGQRSATLTCTIKAAAVSAGACELKVDFISSDNKVASQTASVGLYSTIKHFKGLNLEVDMADMNWASVMLGENQIAGLFQTSVPMGSTPAILRIHFDNAGEDIIGVADGSIINITPLAEGAVIGNGSLWVKNPGWAKDWRLMPVLYSEKYTAWLGKTAYIGSKVSGYNFWFKVTATEDARFILTEFAYDTEGNDIKAGQISPSK